MLVLVSYKPAHTKWISHSLPIDIIEYFKLIRGICVTKGGLTYIQDRRIEIKKKEKQERKEYNLRD